VPKGTRAKDLLVVLQKKKLSVGLKGQDKILDGELCKDVKVEDSTWTLRMNFLSLGVRQDSSHFYFRRQPGCSHSSGEAEPTRMVGERPEASS